MSGAAAAGSMRVLVLLAVGTSALAAQGPLVRTEGWRHIFDPGGVEPGIGAVAFTWPESATWSDTLLLHAGAGVERPVGRFLFASDGAGGWQYAVEWSDTLATNLLEFGYEEVGLPLDSLAADGGWARVVPGFRKDGTPVHAWAAVGGRVQVVRWPERLIERDLFFRDGVTPAFYAAPDGAPAAFPLPGRDYILHPLEARGPWMRVRAVTPSDMCDTPESPRAAELWIRYLDERGRPLVWYHTRGC